MGDLLKNDKRPASKPLKRVGQQTRHQSFPIQRKKDSEFHVYLGFDSQALAEEWIDWGIKDGFLIKADGMKLGTPGKPRKW